jgi:hypothetical protein
MSDINPSFPQKTNLYLNSINSADNSKIQIIIPDGIIKCNDNEDFYISLISFNTAYSFYQVIDGYNNDFKVNHQGTTTSYKIPYGNISVNDILTYFNSIKNATDIILTYDKKINKFYFETQNQNHTCILILTNCHKLLGFDKSVSQVNLTHPNHMYSPNPINVMSITNLYLHLDAGFDINLNDNNLDNFNSINNIVKPNNILCAIPVRDCYNSIISYDNFDGGTSFNFQLNKQEQIQSLSITIKDEYDRIIPNFPDFNIIIQLQKKLTLNPQYAFLNDIRNYLNQIILIISNFLIRF